MTNNYIEIFERKISKPQFNKSFEYIAILLWLTYLWNAYLDGLPDDKEWLDKMISKPFKACVKYFAGVASS